MKRIALSTLLALSLTSPLVAIPRTSDFIFPEFGAPQRLKLPKPVKDISAGVNHTLVLYRDGTVAAWGLNGRGQCDVPSDLKDVKMISSALWFSAALREDGSIATWGKDAPAIDPAIRAKWISGSGDPQGKLAAVMPDGTLKLWGAYPELEAWAKTVSDATQVGWHMNGVIVLRKQGNLLAFPPDEHLPRGDKIFAELRTGQNGIAALSTDEKLSTWAFLGSRQTATDPGGSVRHVAASNGVVALLKDGSVMAWMCGKQSWYDVKLPTQGKTNPPIAVAGGEYCNYAILTDGSVYTWGWDHAGQAAMTSTRQEAKKIISTSHTILLRDDGAVICWPESLDLGSSREGLSPAGLKGKDIAAGWRFNVVLLGDGKLRCWGEDDAKQCHPPEGLSKVAAVAAGHAFAMALTTDGKVVAWGENNAGQCQVPTDLPPIAHIAAGEEHALALARDGRVFFWGKTLAPPEALRDIQAIAAGSHHSLALTKQGRVIAWGNNASRQSEVPESLSEVVAISARGGQSAALTPDGKAHAWGVGRQPPQTTPALRGISCGYAGTFGITKNGDLISWGWDRTRSTNAMRLKGMVPVGVFGQ